MNESMNLVIDDGRKRGRKGYREALEGSGILLERLKLEKKGEKKL